MKRSYPITLKQGKSHIVVYVPDFDVSTQGNDLTEAIKMARDAIGIIGTDMEDDREKLPEPTAMQDVKHEPDEIVTMVDVDFAEYRKKLRQRVKK